MYKKTELEWDKYLDYLEKAINKSKFAKRAEIKPMATPKGAGESHLTSRSNHQRLAAEISKHIAEELGLNAGYTYIGMLMHDAGHPFSAHEGEEIFNVLGRVHNTGYFHHNAKGIEVIQSEDICGKAIDMIPGIEDNPELRRRLEEEFYCFLDIVISHDGEATKKDMKKEPEAYPSMKEAVLTKLSRSCSQDDYKFIAQDDEGRLGKVADVLAYLPTDIQDGFRLGIINKFNDEYLEAFGEMFSDDPNLSKKEKIEFAKKMIEGIKREKLRELKSDMRDPENQGILRYVEEIIQFAQKEGIHLDALKETDREKLDIIIAAKEEEIRSSSKDLDETEQQMLNSDMVKLREFIEKITGMGTDVVAAVTSRMEQYFIKDFVENSKKTGKMEFSKKAEDLYYKIKKLNYTHIVQFTKWDYQRDGQPEAAKELVEICARSLIRSGAIRDKFYDRSIRRYVADKDALAHMVTPKRDEAEYIGYKIRKGIIRGPKTFPGTEFTETNPKKLHKNALYRNVYSFVQKEGKSFAVKYKNVFDAIPHTIAQNVECALSNTTTVKDFLQDFQISANQALRDRMIAEYGSIEEATKRKQEFIDKLIKEERSKMEEKMAIQLSIDYVSGMTDRAFNDLAIRTGYMTWEQVYEAKRDMRPSESVERHIRGLEEDNKASDREDR